MPEVIGGPDVSEVDWGAVERVILAGIIANMLDESSGATVQESGNFGETAALMDEVLGSVGPLIGKWDPEKSSRMIQEF